MMTMSIFFIQKEHTEIQLGLSGTIIKVPYSLIQSITDASNVDARYMRGCDVE